MAKSEEDDCNFDVEYAKKLKEHHQAYNVLYEAGFTDSVNAVTILALLRDKDKLKKIVKKLNMEVFW